MKRRIVFKTWCQVTLMVWSIYFLLYLGMCLTYGEPLTFTELANVVSNLSVGAKGSLVFLYTCFQVLKYVTLSVIIGNRMKKHNRSRKAGKI